MSSLGSESPSGAGRRERSTSRRFGSARGLKQRSYGSTASTALHSSTNELQGPTFPHLYKNPASFAY